MKQSYFDLTGKVALVSGGATGIGLGISEGLAEAGATVVVCSRRLDVCEEAARELTENTGSRIVPLQCDVTNQADIDALVKAVTDTLGKVDVLVNCAGVGGSEKPILKMEKADWDRVMDINLNGAFALSQAVVGPMAQRGEGGRVINVASISGIVGMRNMSAYCSSKGALVQLTKVMALEWVRYNIMVNAILPGYFETPMNSEFFSTDLGKKIVRETIPMRRLGNIREIKGLAILMASEASSFMTGSAVVMDGGYTIW